MKPSPPTTKGTIMSLLNLSVLSTTLTSDATPLVRTIEQMDRTSAMGSLRRALLTETPDGTPWVNSMGVAALSSTFQDLYNATASVRELARGMANTLDQQRD